MGTTGRTPRLVFVFLFPVLCLTVYCSHFFCDSVKQNRSVCHWWSRDGVVVIALTCHQVGFRSDGHEWVKFVVLLYSALRGFSPGSLVFLLSSKISISKFHLNQMHDLPENYSQVNGASWENICGTKPTVIVEMPKGECENNLFYYNNILI